MTDTGVWAGGGGVPVSSGAPTVMVVFSTAWVVQVASLGSRGSADALVTKLRGKGYRAAVGGSVVRLQNR